MQRLSSNDPLRGFDSLSVILGFIVAICLAKTTGKDFLKNHTKHFFLMDSKRSGQISHSIKIQSIQIELKQNKKKLENISRNLVKNSNEKSPDTKAKEQVI